MSATQPGASDKTCIEASFLENALVMIAVIEGKGKIVSWNNTAEKITGYSSSETVGSAEIWKHLYPDPAYRNTITRKIGTIFATGNFLENFETIIRTKPGETRIILWNTKEIQQDGMKRAIAVGLDITGRREAEAFRESIIDNAFVLITVIGRDRNIAVWNKAAESITGYPSSEVLGRNDIWKKLYPDETYRKTVTKKIAGILSGGLSFENLETVIATKSGSRRIISWNTRRIVNAGGFSEIAVGVDITGQREAEEALVAYVAEMAMRLSHPVEIIRTNLHETAELIKAGKITEDEIIMVLEGQARNAAQLGLNVREFQQAVAKRNSEIPEAYRKFLEG